MRGKPYAAPLSLLFACAVAGATLSACADGLDSSEEVTVTFPEPHPAAYLANADYTPTWMVSWYDGEGSVQTKTGNHGSTTIDLEKGRFTPIFATLEPGAASLKGNVLPRAGGIYPDDCAWPSLTEQRGSITVETSWEGGVAARVAEAVCLNAAGGFDEGRTIAIRFNWPRLRSYATQLYDPTKLDLKQISEAILSGSVSKWDIDPIASVDFARSVVGNDYFEPGETIFSEWPKTSPFYWTETASITVFEGLTRFFGANGFLSVTAENGKVVSSFFTRYDLQE